MRLFPTSLFGNAPVQSTVLREAHAPRAEINATMDYLCVATVDAEGRRLKERDVRAALKTLERL